MENAGELNRRAILARAGLLLPPVTIGVVVSSDIKVSLIKGGEELHVLAPGEYDPTKMLQPFKAVVDEGAYELGVSFITNRCSGSAQSGETSAKFYLPDRSVHNVDASVTPVVAIFNDGPSCTQKLLEAFHVRLPVGINSREFINQSTRGVILLVRRNISRRRSPLSWRNFFLTRNPTADQVSLV